MTRTLLLLAIAAPLVFGQSLTVSVTAGGATSGVASGGSVALTATDIGQPALATFVVRYTGATTATVTGVSVSGTSEITLISAPPVPVVLNPNGTTSFTIQYNSASGNAVAAQIAIAYTENNQGSSFAFALTGTSPHLTFSYFLAPNGALNNLNAGGIITYPATNVGSSTSAVITVSNLGTATGSLRSVSLTGSGFALVGSPAPIDLKPGSQANLTVVFTPSASGGALGLLTLGLTASSASFTLTGTGSSVAFTASYTLADGAVHPLSDGTIVSFPATEISGTATAAVTIVNQGTGAGVVNAISVSGNGFQLSGLPPLPATVAAGQSLRFNIVFTPTHAGNFSCNFQIDFGRTITATLSGSAVNPTFALSYVFADNVNHALADGAAISIPSVDVNGSNTATVSILNQGPGSGQITGITVLGNGFRLTGAPVLPASVPAGQTVRFGFTFAPTQAGSFSGTFRIDLTGRSISGSLSASTASPNFTLTYIDPDTNSAFALSDNSTLQFPNTQTTATTSITLQASNTGAGTGSINSITLGGSSPSAFQLLSLPALPFSVAPGQQLRFTVRFSPQQQQAYSANLALNMNGQTTTVNLQAQGIGPLFTYSASSGSTSKPLTADAPLGFADTAVGQTTSMTISVTNSGTGDGQISSLGVTGTGFSLASLPPIPFTLHPNASQQFTLNFSPTQPGAITGKLTIGGDTFSITAAGLGSRLIFTYTNAAGATPVTDGGAIVFPPIAVGRAENSDFLIQNTGTSPAVISSINLTAPTTVFTLQNVPALPFSLDAGASITIAAGFLPNNTGTLTAILRVNSSGFTLSGTGTQPDSLPAYQLQGPSGNQGAAQQPTIGLSLMSPYALPLQGVLKLSFVSAVGTDDPSVQFASGGRTVSFTIPANSTRAVFSGNVTAIPVQAGTTAGSIVITPSLATQGGYDLTPATPDVLSFTIARAAPQLQNASITSQTSTSFVVVLSGYSTTRALRQLDIQFTPKQGENFSTTHLTIDVSSASSTWFQGAASQAYGGSFQLAIPFTLSGSSNSDLVHLLQSLSITSTNDVGQSSAVSVTIP